MAKSSLILGVSCFTPRKHGTNIYYGRSSDLLHPKTSFPFYINKQWNKVMFRIFTGAYSSGSVQDFHLIPFSAEFIEL